MISFRRRENPHALVVGMIGVKLGDRLVQIGCAHGGRLGAIAAKVGLSGRAAAVVPDAESAARAAKGASQEGVLVEVETAPPTALPLDAEAFDLAIIDDTGGLFGQLSDGDRAKTVGEVRRVLRGGGRVMVIGAGPRQGLAAILGGGSSAAPFDAGPALSAGGFTAVRTLAERDGLVFVEALKPRDAGGARDPGGVRL